MGEKIKTILITGGAQGIGQSMANTLNNSNYEIIIVDNDFKAIEEFKLLNSRIGFFFGDVSKPSTFEELIKEFDLSGLYGLINNAAISNNKSIDLLTLEEWERVIAVNLTSAFLSAKYFQPFLKRNKGTIINISSTRALMSEKNTEAYSASKGGILSLTHALAISLGPTVRVNAISPGWIEVGHLKKSKQRSIPVHSETDKIQHPVGKVGQPEDISEMVKFLLSEKSGFITGQNFIVDGGMTKKMIYE